MRKKTYTLRISEEAKKRIDEVKGQASYTQIIIHLVDFFLNKK
jgi:hypothetical protein